MDTWMSGQIERIVEQLEGGASPKNIKGSTTIRLAAALITGKRLSNTNFEDREAWEMLDNIQRRVVAKHRPKSKFAKWFAEEKADEEIRFFLPSIDNRTAG